MFNTPEEVFYSVIAGVVLMLFLATIFILSVVRYQQRAIKFKNEKIALEEKFSKALLQSQLEIQEQTLQNISQELHDNIGQTASLIKIYLNTINYNELDNTKSIIDESKVLLKQLIFDLKSLVLNLDGDRILEQGLLQSLNKDIDRINKIENINASFKHIGAKPNFDLDKTIILYRMVQEALNNAIKHGESTEIKLSLEVKKKLTILSIHDNGIGFDYSNYISSESSGLRNLKKRATLIHSNLSIYSTLGNGTKILIKIPNH